MSNHIHLIISAKEPYKLSDILRDFKKYTSINIIKKITKNNKESRRNWMFSFSNKKTILLNVQLQTF